MGAETSSPPKKSFVKVVMGGFLGLCTGAVAVYSNAVFDRVIKPSKPVANFSAMRGGAIEDDRAGTAFALDHIRFEALAIRQIAAQNPLVRQEADALHQVHGDGEAALIINAGGGDLGTMNLRF